MSRDGERHPKTCGTDVRKRDPEELKLLIQELSNQYSISAICKVLNINRCRFYYQSHPRAFDEELERAVIDSFRRSRNNYGTRRIQAELQTQGHVISRRKISQIMQRHNLASNYTKKQYKPHARGCNEADIPNVLNRDFNRRQSLDVVVSDLTYVKVGDQWCYICLVIDLWNREIVGWSVGRHKDAELVREALCSIPYPLDCINVFHSDRGKEFDNLLISEVMDTFGIQHSLSQKGCPYDNAVIESTNKSLKAEFVYQHDFTSLEDLRVLLFDYVHWYNNVRLHSSLDYRTPASIREQADLTFFCGTPLFTCLKKG